MIEENEKHVRAFYKATVPRHRASLRGLQAPQVIYDYRRECPSAAALLGASKTCPSVFSPVFMGLLTFAFVPEEFPSAGEIVVVLGRIQGKTRKAAVPVDVPFAHVRTVREGYLQRLRAFTDSTARPCIGEGLNCSS